MTENRWGGLLAVLVVMVSLLAGCGGSSGRGTTPRATRGTVLERTLTGIGDDSSVRAFFEFGDIAAQRKLAGVPPAFGAGHPAARWRRILGFGTDYFREDPSGLRDGLDVLRGSVGVVIGQPPHTGGLITGPLLEGPKVRAAIEKLGATPGTVDGRPGLKWGDEGSEHLGAQNQFGVGPGLGEFDRSIITAHTVIAGRYSAEVRTLVGAGSRSAAADPTLAATSVCLGDVVAALGQGTTAHGAPVEVAVGVRRARDPAAPAQEVMCLAGSSSTVRSTGTALCSRIGPGGPSLPGTAERPSQLDTAARPVNGQTGGTHWAGCVVTDRPGVPAGWLLSVLASVPAATFLAGA